MPLSNVCAGIGRGQMMVLEEHVARRRAIHDLYTKLLSGVDGITVKQNPSSDYASNFWLTCIEVDAPRVDCTADDIRLALAEENIESRLLWRPMHMQPVFANHAFYGDGTSERIFGRGLCLPSGSSLTDAQIGAVVEAIVRRVNK